MDNHEGGYQNIIHPDKKCTIFYLDAHGNFVSIAWEQYFTYIQKILEAIKKVFNSRCLLFAVYHDRQMLWDMANYAAKLQGSCVLGLNHLDSKKHVSMLIDIAAPDILICSSGQLSEVESFWDGNVLLIDFDEDFSVKVIYKENIPERQDFFCEYISTSGTTGKPKLYRYTADQVINAVRVISDFYDTELNSIGSSLSWMPLANLFQRMLNMVAISREKTLYYIDDPRQLLKYSKLAKIEFLASIPRLYEKIYSEIKLRLGKIPVAGCFFNFAIKKCSENSLKKLGKIRILYAHIIMRKIVLHIFGPNLKYLLSGSAGLPLSVEIFFNNINLPVYQAYGMSECLLPIALSNKQYRKIGSVGKVIHPSSVRVIDKELYVSSPFLHIQFRDELSDGYYRTGDFCEIDDEGFVFLNGRKSDFFKTSNGRRITPTKVEDALKLLSGINYTCVFGEGLKCPVVIFDVNEIFFQEYPCTNDIISAINFLTSSINAYEIPKVVLVVENKFSPESGEVTTNLKLKRNIISERYLSVALDVIDTENNGEITVRIIP